MSKYTIIAVQHTYGHVTETVEKEQVKSECERLKKIFSIAKENAYTTIEVVNNDTGEVREYWNNRKNEINF